MRYVRLILVLIFLQFLPIISWAQCAMCRTQLENNVSSGDIGIAAGINTGILYLLSLPYLTVLVVWYAWYKFSRKHGNEAAHQRNTAG